VRGALRCCSSEELDLPDKIVIGDIGSDTRWEEALRGVDCVIHLAARVHVMSDAAADPLAAFRQVNRGGTACLAEQAALGRPARLLPVPQRALEFALKMAGKGDMAQRLCGSLQVDISKAKDVLGWCPPVRVDEGVWRAAEWYLREKL